MNTSRSRSRVRATKRPRIVSRSTSARPRTGVGRRTVALAAPSVGLGTSVTTVLRTSFFTNVTGAGTGIFTGFLKPGSAFDPCGDLAAIQPQMFDQFAAMYNRYKVNSATVRIKVTGGNSGSTTCFSWVMASYPCVDSTALTTYQAAASQQYSKTISGGFQTLAATGTGASSPSVTHKLNHNSIVGSKSDAWDIGALVTADPTTLQYMVLPLFLQASAAFAATWMLEIDIFQNTTFSQKKNTVDA